MSIEDILEKYSELARKNLEESLRNPSKTEWINMRVPMYVKEFYRKMPPYLKKAVREGFMRIVVEVFRQYITGKIPELPSNANVVVNVQAPPIIINNVQNSNNVEVRVELGEALSLLRELKQMIHSWYVHGAIPKAAYGNAYGKLKKLEKMLSRQN